MAGCTRVTITKSMPYRGAPEEFANSYCWKSIGSSGTDLVFWNNIRDQVLAAERTIFGSVVKFVDIYGWNDSNPQVPHVYYYAWPVGSEPTGSLPNLADGQYGSGDQAAVVQWPATLKSSRGKPVYFRKYFHRPWVSFSDVDQIAPDYLAALNAYAGPSHNIANLNGPLTNQFGGKAYGPLANSAAGNGIASPYVTTRTLRRRGKRPLPKP